MSTREPSTFRLLEENGIEVDVVAGCSMGAYVVAIWGYGCHEKTMEGTAGQSGVLVDPVFRRARALSG
jgi:hypothetical protein